jgi:CheY-like chemotaxis protein
MIATNGCEATQRARVLVVDDNADAADMLAELLREAGHEVAVAYDAGGALEVARTFHPEVALLDIGLPTMDGHELAHRIRSEHPSVRRVIAVSGYAERGDGFDDHLMKPIDLDALFELLQSASG